MKGERFCAFDINTIVSSGYGEKQQLLKKVTFEHNTALHIAAREGHPEIVQGIVKNAKAMCAARNSDGNTALHEAAKGGNAEVVRILRDHNMKSASLLNKFGETALLIAIMYDHTEAAKLLVKATSVYLLIRPSVKGQTCLGLAAFRGFIGKEDGQILGKWVSPNRCKRYVLKTLFPYLEKHILHEAVSGGHLHAVHTIVTTRGWEEIWLPSMTKFDSCGRCPIHIAASMGRWDVVKEFLSSSPGCLEIRSADRKTPLHFAVEYNQADVVAKLLCNKSAKQIARLVSYDRDSSGNTALHLAAIAGVDLEVLENLLKLGVEMNIPNDKVDVNAINAQRKTPLDIALDVASQDQPKYSQIIQILGGAGARRSFIQPPWHSVQSTVPKEEDVESKLTDVDILVASLIATVTFSAIFQIPGGVEDDKNSIKNGTAKMALEVFFQEFIFFNTLAFFTSLTVVVCSLFRKRLQSTENGSVIAILPVLFLGLSVVSTGIAFYIATLLVTIPRHVKDLKSNHRHEYSNYTRLISMESTVAYYAPYIVLLGYWGILLSKFRHKLISGGETYLKINIKGMILAAILALLYASGYISGAIRNHENRKNHFI